MTRRRGLPGVARVFVWSALVGVLLAVAAQTAAVAAAPAPVVDRPLNDARITEASGLAPSLLHPGVLWTHNDSGNPPRLYALGRSGAVTAAITLSGTVNLDWEAMASFRDGRNRAMLAVGDIGDNAAVRRFVQIVLVPEPSRLTTATLAPERLLRLTYPDGRRDAEALLVDPRTRRMYVVSKGLFGGRAYAVPARVYPGLPGSTPTDTGVLEPIGGVPLSLVTDGVTLPDGRILLRTYTSLSLIAPVERAGGVWTPQSTVALPAQRQGEGLAVPAGGTVALLASEGRGQPVLRFALPAAFRAIATPPVGPAVTPQGSVSRNAVSQAPASVPQGLASGSPVPLKVAPVAAVAGSTADRWRIGVTVLVTVTGIAVCAAAGLAERRRRGRAGRRHRELSRAGPDPGALGQTYPRGR